MKLIFFLKNYRAIKRDLAKIHNMKYWKSHRTETPTISFFWRQWDTSDLNANISKLTNPLNNSAIKINPDNNSHYVQHTNQCSQAQEPWIGLE